MNQNEIEYLLSGTGCSNIAELRTAFDILRDRLFVNYNDAWSARRIAGAVTERTYLVKNNENPDQLQFDWRTS